MVIPPNNNIGKSSSGAHSTQSESVSTRKTTAGSDSPAKSPSPTTGDEVSLSPQAKRLAALEASAQQQSGVDEAKVAALKEAVDNGTYQVDSMAVSKKMLNTESLFS